MNKLISRGAIFLISHHYQATGLAFIHSTSLRERRHAPYASICRNKHSRSISWRLEPSSWCRRERTRNFNRSFVDEEQPRRSSSGSSHHRNINEESSYKDSDDRTKPDLTSDRLALGLSGSGPLSLEDVKNAYRACAMKWHPDHHGDSSKAIAEAKFKTLNAAYESLCDKMALNHEVSEAH